MFFAICTNILVSAVRPFHDGVYEAGQEEYRLHGCGHFCVSLACYYSIGCLQMLILGGAAVVNALTGVDLYAASMLIPVGVILYTAAGGLKATFMCALLSIPFLFFLLLMCELVDASIGMQ